MVDDTDESEVNVGATDDLLEGSWKNEDEEEEGGVLQGETSLW